jgi:hypothetical protein
MRILRSPATQHGSIITIFSLFAETELLEYKIKHILGRCLTYYIAKVLLCA